MIKAHAELCCEVFVIAHYSQQFLLNIEAKEFLGMDYHCKNRKRDGMETIKKFEVNHVNKVIKQLKIIKSILQEWTYADTGCWQQI